MKTWGSEILTSSDMNTYLRDNIEYLKGVADGVSFSGVEVTRAATTSISDGVAAEITWTAETYDYGGWWGSGTDVIVPAGAIPSGFTTIAVLCTAAADFASNGTGRRELEILKNGTRVAAPNVSAISGDTTQLTATRFTTAVAGDVFTVELFQNSGGNLDTDDIFLSVVRFLPAE